MSASGLLRATSSSMPSDSFVRPFQCGDGQKICLDAADFDPVKAMDMLLGEEPDVEEVKALMAVLQQQVSAVNRQVLTAVRAQSVRASKAHEGLAKAQADITALDSSIGAIERGAAETEERVDAICKDIRAMDHAKRHLTVSISTLENFGTLTEAVRDLEATGLERSMYAANAEKLEGVVLLMEKFGSYHHVPKMAQLKGIVDTMTQNLHARVQHEFEMTWAFNDPLKHHPLAEDMLYEERERVRDRRDAIVLESQHKFQALKDSCRLASALGARTHSREAIVERIVSTWITSFLSLEVTPRTTERLDDHFRTLFQWLQNIFTGQFFAEQWKVFPPDWEVQKSLALAFCGAMKKHMRQELEAHAQLGAGATAEQASEDLLAALQVSRQFEGFLTAQIEGGRVAGGGDTDVHAARLRLLSYVSDQRDRDPDSEPALFKGILTDVFSDFLQPYVDYERAQLLAYLDEVLAADAAGGWAASQVASTKLDSAHALLTRCRDVAERCCKVASQGAVFVRFTTVVDDVLQTYASRLRDQVPTSTKGHRKGKGRYVFSEVDMDPSGARRACAIAGTAEYAETVTPQMVDYLCTLCEEERAGDVSLEGARDALEALASSAVSAVINGLLTQASRLIDGPLPSGPSEGISVMTASTHAWQLDETGDTSKYARSLASTLNTWGPVMYKGLVTYDSDYTANELVFWHVCTKVLHVFVPYLLQNGILKLRKLNQVAVQQLLLDVNAIADALRAFPAVAFQVARLDEQSALSDKIEEYRATVTAQMTPVVNLVKVLTTQHDESFVQLYCATLPHEWQNATEMTRLLAVLDLRPDQRDARMLSFSMHAVPEMNQQRRGGQNSVAVARQAGGLGDLAARTSAGWTMPSGVRNMASMRASGASMLSQGGKALKATTEFSKRGTFSSFFKFGGPSASNPAGS